MKSYNLYRDDKGAVTVEFTLTLPIFIALMFGVVEVGSLTWINLGLQHAVELAARCASVNAALCGSTVAQIQNFAAQNSYGLNPPASSFTVNVTNTLTPLACGNQVYAQTSFSWMTAYFFNAPSKAITAQSCFPLNS